MAQDYEIAQENYEAYCYYRDNGHLDFVTLARKCEGFFIGDAQWDETVRNKLRAAKRPALTMNMVLPALASIWSQQINARVDGTFRPAKNGSQEIADLLAKLFIQISNNNNLPWLQSEVFADGTITSRGFFDVRMDYTDNIRGDIRITKENPMNVLIDPDASDYDPSSWDGVIVSKWMSLRQIDMLYGSDAAEELKSLIDGGRILDDDFLTSETFSSFGGTITRTSIPSDEKGRRVRIIQRQHNELRTVEHFVDIDTGEARPVPEHFDRERIQEILSSFSVTIIKRPVMKKRWVVSTGDTVLHNKISPYDRFTIIPYFPFFRYGRTLGLVENLIDPQELHNKTLSQELHVINSTANSGYKLKHGALQNMSVEDLEERGAETGLVVELDEIANMEKFIPNQVPTGLDRLSFISLESLKAISMSSDSLRGFDREDVAAKAILAKQAVGGGNFAKPMDNLHYSHKLLMQHVLYLMQTFYTDERIFAVTGREIGAETEQVAINQVSPEGEILNDITVGEYDVVITNVPARASFEESQFMEALEMRKNGIAIPDYAIVEHSHLSHKDEIAKILRAQAGGGEPSQMQVQQQQLELQKVQLEVSKLEAESQKLKADAALSLMKAQEAAAGGGQQGKSREELMLEYEAKQKEFELKQQQIAAELEMKREELDLKREEMATKLMFERARSEMDLEDRHNKMMYDSIERESARGEAEEQQKYQREKEKIDLQSMRNKASTTRGKTNG